MYVNLDGGSGGESCPSVADSAAVSLSQMAFLSMSVSIFSTVANIANNLNNNNNNQNDNNLNYVHQQNNNLNMNQNIINQLNIDLPPPVPGKRSISDVFSMAKIKKMMNATSSQADCNTDYTAKASEALLDILKVAVYNQIENEGSRACLGKQLCQSSQQLGKSGVWTTLLTLQSAGLAYLQLEDHSADFGQFIENIAQGNSIDCQTTFIDCLK
eukprot:TRINITY_DN37511_c0_g1_i1.p1 TRINITY_DN37511_c0_g1~~TRINITY_DN37511_c0_g1_i1.p1  ORF type:complete len:214 (+),score=53.34 TRINITY_DN37511_c0_g1_i1:59-700(+)